MFARSTIGSLLAALALVAGAATQGCSTASEEPSNAPSSTDAVIDAQSLSRAYRGTLGGSEAIVRLGAEGNNLYGSRFTPGGVTTRHDFELKGILFRRSVSLDELLEGKKTGHFEGSVGANGHLTGIWRNAEGNDPRPFTFAPIPNNAPFTVQHKSLDRALTANGFARSGYRSGGLRKLTLRWSCRPPHHSAQQTGTFTKPEAGPDVSMVPEMNDS